MKKVKQPSKANQEEKYYYERLDKIRTQSRNQTSKALKNIKNNSQLNAEEIKEAQQLFQNCQIMQNHIQKSQVKKDKKQKRNKLKNTPKEVHNKMKNAQFKQKNINTKQNISKNNGIQGNKPIRQNQKNARKQSKNNAIQIIQYDDTRKWNQVLENPKTGKYEPQQVKLLMRSLSQYLIQNNIELQQVIDRIDKYDESQNVYGNLKMWTTVCSVLPQRPLRSTYKFLMRKLSANNKGGKWTQKQEDYLLELHSEYGNSWKNIAKKLNRTPQNVRDKYRNLCKRNTNSQNKNNHPLWKIQQLVALFNQISKMSKIKFIKQGINKLVQDSDLHNNRQLQDLKTYKYNSKYVISHNNIQIMQYIDADKFGKVQKSLIKWKQISDKLQNKSETQCKNKYNQFMEIFNKDYSGESEGKVISFIQQNIKKMGVIKREQEIDWRKWDQKSMKLSIEQAKIKWRMIKKKIKNRTNQTFSDIVQQAKNANQKKKAKYYFKLDRNIQSKKSKNNHSLQIQQQLEKQQLEKQQLAKQQLANININDKQRKKLKKKQQYKQKIQKKTLISFDQVNAQNKNSLKKDENMNDLNIISKQLQKISSILNKGFNIQQPAQKIDQEEEQQQKNKQKQIKKVAKKKQRFDRQILRRITKEVIQQQKKTKLKK